MDGRTENNELPADSTPRRSADVAVYWLTPLLTKEMFNAGHMELILLTPLIAAVTIITASPILLSPSPFPWCYLWVLPLWTMRPTWSLLLLTAILPLYYPRFPMTAQGHAMWFDYGIVWLQFMPVCVLLIWELRRFGPTSTAGMPRET